MRFSGSFLIAIVMVGAWAPVTSAQTSEDPSDTARLRFGPLGVTPSVAVTNFGVDGNVFNEVDDPKKDFTFVLSPQMQSWFRAGRSRTAASLRTDLVYFQQYASERSVDADLDARIDIPGNRLTPWLSGGYANGRQRVGYEIDLRSRRVAKDVGVGIAARVASKTRVLLSGQRTRYAYDADAILLGTSLQEVLNHTSQSIDLQLHHTLTALTTVVIQGQGLRDRFEFAQQRDADSIRVQGGVDLDPLALIAGRVRVGYRRFKGVGGGLPEFTGLVATVGANFTVAGRTKVDVTGDRDVSYSFEREYPYYVLTGAIVTATPRLTEKWDVQLRTGRQRLAYRALEFVAAQGRIDRYTVLGTGVGYHVGREMRVGFNVDRERRSSAIDLRQYHGYRLGTSVTYGR